METETFQQYILEVKQWAQEVQSMMEDVQVDREILDQWNEQMEKLIGELEDKLNVEDQREITQIDVEGLESKVKELYEQSQKIVGSAEGRNDHGERVQVGEHTLPPLPYSYDALEPYISEEIMKLHHDEHHKSYVKGLNKAEEMMERARKTGDYDLIKHWEREAAFHGSGHYLHTIFWNNMSPKSSKKPTGALLRQLKQDFGSFEKFKAHFSEAAKKVEGVGWAILVWSPRSHRLEILQSEKHQLFTQWDTIPLLVLDVWEHAYYLQYKNKRSDYVNNWWNVVNWDDVQTRFREAKKLKWHPY